jgi:hypothetical protein
MPPPLFALVIFQVGSYVLVWGLPQIMIFLPKEDGITYLIGVITSTHYHIWIYWLRWTSSPTRCLMPASNHNPEICTSQIADITGISHHAWALVFKFLIHFDFISVYSIR